MKACLHPVCSQSRWCVRWVTFYKQRHPALFQTASRMSLEQEERRSPEVVKEVRVHSWGELWKSGLNSNVPRGKGFETECTLRDLQRQKHAMCRRLKESSGTSFAALFLAQRHICQGLLTPSISEREVISSFWQPPFPLPYKSVPVGTFNTLRSHVSATAISDWPQTSQHPDSNALLSRTWQTKGMFPQWYPLHVPLKPLC